MLWESLVLSTVLAVAAALKKALTPWGTVLAWLFCTMITYIGGIPAFVILASTYAFTILADKIAGNRADPKCVRRKSGSRDCTRVFCNVCTGAAAMLLFGITGNQMFFIAYASVMAASLADSLASKMGPLSKRPPVDICTLHRIDAGISGGVSLEGIGASLLCGTIIGTIYVASFELDYTIGALISLLGLAGSVIDSILGSLVQVKYICPVCKIVTERQAHCGTATRKHKGFRWVNNDVVNLSSNVLVLVQVLLVFR